MNALKAGNTKFIYDCEELAVLSGASPGRLISRWNIDMSVHVFRGVRGVSDLYREFTAAVEYSAENGPHMIGRVRGWIGRDIADEGRGLIWPIEERHRPRS